MELVQKNSKIVLDAIGRIWINKIGKKDLFQTIFSFFLELFCALKSLFKDTEKLNFFSILTIHV